MTSEIYKYIVGKLNVNGVKKQNIDSYLQMVSNNLKLTQGFNNVIVVPTTQTESRFKIIYQIKDNNGNYHIQDVEI